jgi:hypothetical protein
MKRPRIQHLCWLLILIVHVSSISLLGMLQSDPELSTLYGYVNTSSTGLDLLENADNFTFIAPSNAAIASLLALNPAALSNDLLDASLHYSPLNGEFLSDSFTSTPQFIPTSLTDTTFANVTGGQRVELLLGPDGLPQIVSGNQSVGHISTVSLKIVPHSIRHTHTCHPGTRLRRWMDPNH